jgi:hypothetical protein
VASNPLIPVIAGLLVGVLFVGFFSLNFQAPPKPDPCSISNMMKPSTMHSINPNLVYVQYGPIDPETKMDPFFRDRINCMIEHGETRQYGVIIIVADENKDLLIKTLTEDHGVKEYGRGKALSFVTANVPIQEIPKLGQYDFVGIIGDGEAKISPHGA